MTLPRPLSPECIFIGASAGGVQALLRLLRPLPRSYALPLVAVIHLPDDRDSRLVEVFAERLDIRAAEAIDKAPVAPGTLHFAPAGYHLSVEADRRFSLSCEPPRMFSRPSIDVLLESAAHAFGPRAAGIVLTGASEDGAAGLAAIGAAGGLTAVQDPREAESSTMPEAAITRRQPHHVLPIAELTRLLATLPAKAPADAR